MFQMPLGIMNRFVPEAIVNLMMEYPIVPTRNPDGATPRPRRQATELSGELRAGLDDTMRLLSENRDLDFDRMVSEHPLMGSNTVPKVLALLTRHERRHQRQMDVVR